MNTWKAVANDGKMILVTAYTESEAYQQATEALRDSGGVAQFYEVL